MPIMSVRLDEKYLAKIKDLAGRENKDQSTVARELIAGGWDYLMIRRYKEGRLSLGRLAEQLEKSIAETLDLLADLGVPAPMDYDDYLKGFEHLGLGRGGSGHAGVRIPPRG